MAAASALPIERASKDLALLTLPWLLGCSRRALARLLPTGIFLLLLTRLTWLIAGLTRVVLAWLIRHGRLLKVNRAASLEGNVGKRAQPGCSHVPSQRVGPDGRSSHQATSMNCSRVKCHMSNTQLTQDGLRYV